MEIYEKICFKCKIKQPIINFYKQKNMSDGHLNKCKNCTKKDTKDRVDRLLLDDTWVEKEKERSREKYHRLNYRSKYKPDRDRKKETIKRYHQKYPEKFLATKYTEIFLEKENGYHLHHWSYNQEHWLDTIKLTIKEHNFIHRFIKYDNDYKMYRDSNGYLLDTRDKHQDFLNKCFENHYN